MTMTKDIGDHLSADFSAIGLTKPKQQARQPPSQRPAAKPARPPAQKPKKPPAKKEPPKSQEFLAKAKIVSEKYKRGELSKEQYKIIRGKLTALVDMEITTLKKKMSFLENKFLNNQVPMEKYNKMSDSLNKEIKRLSGLRTKIAPK
jgi:hypothetical protein